MLVFIKAFAGGLIPLIMSFVIFLAGGIGNPVKNVLKTAVNGISEHVVTVVKSEDAGADTAKTERETRKSRREKLEAERDSLSARRDSLEKSKKAVKISITDKGIRIGTGDNQEEILHLDAEKIKESIGDAIEGLGEQLGDIDADLDIDGLTKREFTTIRNDEIVKFGENIHVRANEMVRGDVVAILGSADIDGKVTGNVVSILGDVDLGPRAIVNGEVVCILGELKEDVNARVRGQTTVVGGNNFNYPALPFFSVGGNGVLLLLLRVMMFIVGVLLLLIIIYFLPARMKNSSEYVFGSFFKSIGMGILTILLGSVLVVILMVVLSITIIGIPVAILLGLSFVALIILGYYVSALALGRVIVRKFGMQGNSPFIQAFVGLFALSLLSILASMFWFHPIFTPAKFMLKTLSGFLNFLAIFTGTGAFILSRGGSLMKKQAPQIPEIPEEG